MKKIVVISALLASIGIIYGCAPGNVKNVNKVTLADLTARSIGVDDKTVTIKDVEIKRNYGFIPPPVYYEWNADTPKGQYRCNTVEGYTMGSVMNLSSGCHKTSN